ncbi:MAG: FeoB-associated Cys-rich membrane protein [Thermodesulfobacteriota bacterium]
MTWTDLFLAGGIALGALYLLYRSLWKKRGYCPGCEVPSCPARPEKNSR